MASPAMACIDPDQIASDPVPFPAIITSPLKLSPGKPI
jgi:hypothetical protein